jgi:hypothetical protein
LFLSPLQALTASFLHNKQLFVRTSPPSHVSIKGLAKQEVMGFRDEIREHKNNVEPQGETRYIEFLESSFQVET